MTSSDTPEFLPFDERERAGQLVRSLFDAAPDAMLVIDEQGRIVLANLQTQHIFGYPSAELLGQPVEVLIPERYRAGHTLHRAAFAANSRVRAMGSGLELLACRRDGSEFPVEISLSPLRTQQGLLVSASIRDISERKQAELRIQRLQSQVLAAMESIQGAFAIFDERDTVVLCNSEYRALLGRALTGELIGRSFDDLLTANVEAGTFDLAEPSAARLAESWRERHREPHDPLEVHFPDGRSLRIIERRTADGGVVTTIWDLTADFRREEELRRARASADAANRAKSEFLASMSHELRTPLNAILGFAQLLQRDKKEPLGARHLERVEHVLKGGEHLLRLIDEVLDLSRIESGQIVISPEAVSVAEVLTEVKTILDPMAARAGVTITVEQPPASLPQVTADRTRFRQVLMNFGSNAIKYGRAGGRAVISAEHIEEFVRICISDDGIGIPEDKQDKLFQPFQRAGQETGAIEGTGIGLTITRRLAELMGGSVGFRSTHGEGSEFWLDLHARRGHEPRPTRVTVERAEGSPLRDASGVRYLVVYVEDNPSNIAFMEDLLADFGSVDLMVAPTAEIGIELVRGRSPNVVLMDINLPGMSGFEATERLKQWPETAHIPVIALSAAAMTSDRKRVAETGFFRYLTKPVKVDDLAEALEAALQHQP